MSEYVIMSDSSLDLLDEEIEQHGIEIVSYMISTDGITYKKDRIEIPTHDFFEQTAANPGKYPKTSMPPFGDYYEKMKEAASQGKDVLCICMSGKLTSSWQSAENAAEMVMEEFPGIQVEVLDSTLATALEGLFVLEAAKMRDAGYSLQENLARLKEIQKTGSIFFTIGSLDYLIHGGRIGKAAGLAARSLHLKPLILMEKGELFPLGVTRTRKSSWNKMMSAFCKHVEDNILDLNNCSITTGYGLDEQEGQAFHDYAADLLKERFGYEGEFKQEQIGATLCVHIGPYPLGIGIIEKGILPQNEKEAEEITAQAKA